jgi:hypothetical protein
MRPMRRNQGAWCAPLSGLVLLLGLGVTLAVLSGCSHDPSRPGRDTLRTQPPAQLPDDYPTTIGDVRPPLPPVGGDPGQPVPPGHGPMWVRFRAFNDSARPDVGLWILREGRAAAMSLAEGPPAHAAWLTPDTLRIVAGWFDTAGFRGLTRDSYFNGGEPGRICEIFLGDSTGEAHRVIGEEAALPEPLRVLARDLEGLTMHILLTPPVGPPIPPPGDSTVVPPGPPILRLRSDLTVVPPSAPEGTPRTIRLGLWNDSPDSVVLHFRTSQVYDLVLMDGRMGPPPGDSTWVPPNPPNPPHPPIPGDSTWVPPNPPNPPHPPIPGDSTWVPPGAPGPCPGHGPGGPRHHGLIGILRGPGMPPDSGGCGGGGGGGGRDTSWVPPDSTGMPHNPRLIWNWAYGQAFLQVPMRVILPPGGTLTYTETWNGKSNEGKPVERGSYLLMAPILANLPMMSGMTRVEVTGP